MHQGHKAVRGLAAHICAGWVARCGLRCRPSNGIADVADWIAEGGPERARRKDPGGVAGMTTNRSRR